MSAESSSGGGASYGTAPFNDLMKQEDLREVLPDYDDPDLYVSNKVVTAKYTWYTFLPLSLLEQFNRASNAFFLVLCILMYIGTYTELFDSPSTPWSTLWTLVVVVAVAVVKSAIEDSGRQVADHAMNLTKCSRVCRYDDNSENMRIPGNSDTYITNEEGVGIVEKITWGDVKVGDLLYIEKDEQIPADVVLLSAAGDGNHAYVETSNIDGEINIKVRNSARIETSTEDMDLIDEPEHFCRKKFSIFCEAPNSSIHVFKGIMLCNDVEISLDADSLLLRGSTLKNTEWAIGAVVYTGRETKTVMNSRDAPFKMSSIERTMNDIINTIILTMLVLTVVGEIMYVIVKAYKYDSQEYLCYGESGSTFSDIFSLCDTSAQFPDYTFMFSFFILFSGLLPIAMYVLVELANFSQSHFIENDLNMYDEGSDMPATAKSTNMNGDLGMIDYIFSDKTGTLTQNMMVFRRCSVGGRIYGAPLDESADSSIFEHMDDLKNLAEGDESDYRTVEAEFVLSMALCHTIVASMETDAGSGLPKPVLQAESPDEEALCQAAMLLGCSFIGREPGAVILEDKYGKRLTYELLATIPFDSTRKRMSSVVRRPDGSAVAYCKGADEVIFDRLDDISQRTVIAQHLQDFSNEGLRTLVLAKRDLTGSECDSFIKQWQIAGSTVTNREKLIEDAAASIEKKLSILGATAIEDKLQDGVPETLRQIHEAGIKLWVLTGDKVETAINIGFSSGMLVNDMTLIKLIAGDESRPRELEKTLRSILRALEPAEIPSWAGTVNVATADDDNDSVQLGASYTNLLDEIIPSINNDSDRVKSNLALVVDGITLLSVFADPLLEEVFLQVALFCKAVLACRVSPEQKRLLVRLVKLHRSQKSLTLAIGDGANDVAMIQEAQIGVGISGREGRQAANSSDFAIAQFRFLRRLLFVHGRTNYVRNCTLISFTLFKSYVLTALMFLYIFFTDFTAENVFNAMVQSSYNVILAIPVWLLGTFNRDVSEHTLEEHRFLYGTGRRKENLNLRVVLELALQGLSDILIIFFVPYFCFNYDVLGYSGTTVGHVVWGTMVYTYFIIAMTIRTATLTCTWTVWNFAGFGIAFLLELTFLLIYQSSVDLSWDFYSVTSIMTASSPFWLLAFLVSVTCWYVNATLRSIREEINPSLTDIGRALDRGEKVNLEKYAAFVSTSEATESALRTAVEEVSGNSSVQVSNANSGNSTNFDHTASEQTRNSNRGLFGTLRRVIFPSSEDRDSV